MPAPAPQVQYLHGKVVTGLGNFSYWMTLLGDLYASKTGMRLFPGTLNLQLDRPWETPRRRAIRIEKEEYGGRVSVSIIPCRVFGRKAFIVRTDQNEPGTGDHARSIVEIATDVKLREVYSLTDGSEVEVELWAAIAATRPAAV